MDLFYLESVSVGPDLIGVAHTEPAADVDPITIRSTMLRVQRSVIPRADATLAEALDDLLAVVAPELAKHLAPVDVSVTGDEQAVLTCQYPRRGPELGRAEFPFNPVSHPDEVEAVSDAAREIVDAAAIAERHPGEV